MTFNILIPEINSKPKNTKDAVISILTIEWPLTLREIFYKIKKQYRFSCSYQSVYKAVKELSEKEVLRKKYKKYEINIDWIKKVQSLTDIVETNYYAKKRINQFSGLKEHKEVENLIILNFNNLFDAEKYLYYFMKTELFKKKNQIICYQARHEWRPLFYLRAEYNYFTRLKKLGHKFHFLTTGTSYLEDISNQFYKILGIKIAKTEDKNSSDTLIFTDYFIQIFIPQEINQKIGESLEKKDLITLLKILSQKGPIKIIINKDKSLANEMKKQILKKF
ncbi:MAG: hypothetical protein QT05_C0041G0009 [archaeon GW2011_AR13]|nr:MAG: hypothetical protein QT05_C0041G0009 [archaeon GW2011_AR13]HIG94927.1 hypothetical protein [Nanoarchaeota archaeon]HIH63572.1 hypothetical protein [Nanoarchaeota archaeon]HIJ10173.1 hypothetical protein [Nanoarchaeota archaeon]